MSILYLLPDDGGGEEDPPEEITLPTQFVKTDDLQTSNGYEIYIVNDVFEIEQFNEYCTTNNLTPMLRVENTKFNKESDYYTTFKNWITNQNQTAFNEEITNNSLTTWFNSIETVTLLFIFKTKQ